MSEEADRGHRVAWGSGAGSPHPTDHPVDLPHQPPSGAANEVSVSLIRSYQQVLTTHTQMGQLQMGDQEGGFEVQQDTQELFHKGMVYSIQLVIDSLSRGSYQEPEKYFIWKPITSELVKSAYFIGKSSRRGTLDGKISTLPQTYHHIQL